MRRWQTPCRGQEAAVESFKERERVACGFGGGADGADEERDEHAGLHAFTGDIAGDSEGASRRGERMQPLYVAGQRVVAVAQQVVSNWPRPAVPQIEPRQTVVDPMFWRDLASCCGVNLAGAWPSACPADRSVAREGFLFGSELRGAPAGGCRLWERARWLARPLRFGAVGKAESRGIPRRGWAGSECLRGERHRVVRDRDRGQRESKARSGWCPRLWRRWRGGRWGFRQGA